MRVSLETLPPGFTDGLGLDIRAIRGQRLKPAISQVGTELQE